MKLRTPDNLPRRVKAKEALDLPEVETSPFAQLEALYELERSRAMQALVDTLLYSVEKKGSVGRGELGRMMGSDFILKQAFTQPPVPAELEHKARLALYAPEQAQAFIAKAAQPGFELIMFWFQTAFAQLYPRERATLGVTDAVFEEWLSRFPQLQDHIASEYQPFVLSYLAQLRPDRQQECRQVLEKIGLYQPDLGQETWERRGELLKGFDDFLLETVVGTRLLQPERSLTAEEKVDLLQSFLKRRRSLRASEKLLSQYAGMAILLAPGVEIGTDGGVKLLRAGGLKKSPELPPRPGV